MLEELKKLIEQWTRAEIIARFVPFGNKEFGDYARIQIEKEDEIRRLTFGTDDLVKLGIKWGLLKDKAAQQIEDTKQANEDLKQQYLWLQKELAKLEKENASS